MDRFNSLLVFFLLLSFIFAVSVSATIVSPDIHDVVVVATSTTDDRNTSSSSTTSNEEEDEELVLDLLIKDVEHHFTNFVKKFGKTYADDQDEYAYRLSVFKSNLHRAKRNQKNDPSAVHGITKFFDLTPMEFRRNLLGGGLGRVKRVKLLQNEFNQTMAPIIPNTPDRRIPPNLDWANRGFVTFVKNQWPRGLINRSCESSYAFATIAALESAFAVGRRGVFYLSVQQLIDCSYQKYGGGEFNRGCNGGNLYFSFEYLFNTGFLDAKYYGYVMERGTCNNNTAYNRPVRGLNFSVVNSLDEYQIAANLKENGPLAVTMNINLDYLFTYRGGVSCPIICPPKRINQKLDQSVLLVGYGDGSKLPNGVSLPIGLKKVPYWNFKNSWGTSWGENGYYRTCRGVDACGGIDTVITVSHSIRM